MKCNKGLLGPGANTHQQFLASILKIEKPVALISCHPPEQKFLSTTALASFSNLYKELNALV